MEKKSHHDYLLKATHHLSSPDPAENNPPPAPKMNKDSKEEGLLPNGRWGAAITLMCYFYGNMTITARMPKDPRQVEWLSSKSPVPTLVASLCYVALVTWLGPKFMRNRQPVKGLRYLMMLYNAFQVVFNLCIFIQAGVYGWFTTYKLFCEPCNFSSRDHAALMILDASFLYYVSKFIDFIDTIFFVVHKKYDHISLLHVTHHALMPVGTWFGMTHQPGGHMTFMGFANSFVHVVMYSYYFLAAMGPQIRPYLWWKKYITTLQMVQFIAMFVHSFAPLLFLDCKIPHEFARWVGGMALVFQILFTDFYIKAYRKKSSSTSFQVCKLDTDELKDSKRRFVIAEDEEGILSGPHTGAISKNSLGSQDRFLDAGQVLRNRTVS